MPDLQTIIKAKHALTLASVPAGFIPLLLADLSRAANGRTLFIAPDDGAMRSISDAVPFFAPELEILQFPAWDCLPYDRASPSLTITSQRMATLQALQQPVKAKQLILTTIGAVIQRLVTPFRIRQTGERLKTGHSISRDRLGELLIANGYFRVDTVAEPGEFAMRGSIVDLVPAGSEDGLRLDFFGDEIETMRRFDPSNQLTIGKVDHFDILPAVEAMMDEESIRRFRVAYRERFGVTATGDPLYQAVSEGRRLSGMDHWLPLFEERMETLFDHIGSEALIIRDAATPSAAQSRLDAISDYYDNRIRAQSGDVGSYRPLPPEMLYLNAEELEARFAAAPAHLLTPFHQPDH
jgi:transcription-repair coupling factor (superfamily II helicase)